mmetsp:Transcript_34758/g.75377  ORF Transcript_34758/g.75377 Transcript_34758/m.75377 type:complete len:94 (+) Transcript_34758:954-1235(+)
MLPPSVSRCDSDDDDDDADKASLYLILYSSAIAIRKSGMVGSRSTRINFRCDLWLLSLLAQYEAKRTNKSNDGKMGGMQPMMTLGRTPMVVNG